jgi:hypothetical protein
MFSKLLLLIAFVAAVNADDPEQPSDADVLADLKSLTKCYITAYAVRQRTSQFYSSEPNKYSLFSIDMDLQ